MPAHRKNSKVSCKEKDSSKSAKSTRSKRQRNDSSDEENQPQKTKRLRCDANIEVQDVELEDEEPASEGSIIELDDEEEPVVVGSDEQGSEVSFPKMFADDLLIWKLRIWMTRSTTVT